MLILVNKCITTPHCLQVSWTSEKGSQSKNVYRVTTVYTGLYIHFITYFASKWTSMFGRICNDQNVLKKIQYYLPFHFDRQWKKVNMTVWRNSPWCIFSSLKCHSSCLELWDVRGMCICLSFNKLFCFFSKMNLELNLFLPSLCLLSSVSPCHV